MMAEQGKLAQKQADIAQRQFDIQTVQLHKAATPFLYVSMIGMQGFPNRLTVRVSNPSPIPLKITRWHLAIYPGAFTVEVLPLDPDDRLTATLVNYLALPEGDHLGRMGLAQGYSAVEVGAASSRHLAFIYFHLQPEFSGHIEYSSQIHIEYDIGNGSRHQRIQDTTRYQVEDWLMGVVESSSASRRKPVDNPPVDK
jgi:hypothetical protein